MRLKRILPALLIIPFVGISAYLLRAQAAKAAGPASAEVKVGRGVDKLELQGESGAFKVAPGTRIYAWTKVTGAADSTIAFVFTSGAKSSRQELRVPRSPYRTHAYRTFRKGDEGPWTVAVVSSNGAELGKAEFAVEFQ